MYKLNHITKKELARVQEKITKELASEKIIQDIYEYIFQSEGKKTRALIALLASQSKKIKPLKRIELASIIELLHTATLVHDDVVDQSNLRRGEKSVNQVWNNSYSVLMGDFIYSKAFMLMMKLDRPYILNELAEATNDIARGEIIQLNLFENSLHLGLDDLLKVSYLKTGRLFEAATKTGAMLANSSDADIKNFGLLGKTLGIAFQIQDDILDYESLHTNTGKPALQDFQEGKITFPLFYALKHLPKNDKTFLLEHLGSKKLTKTLKNRVFSLVRSEMALQSTQTLLDAYISKTKKRLDSLNHHSCYNEMLNLIMFSSQRKS
jgi:octaprenyl-diphosphate synthase